MIESKYTFKPLFSYKEQLECDLKDKLLHTKTLPERVYAERSVYTAMFGSAPKGWFSFLIRTPEGRFSDPYLTYCKVEIVPEGT